MDWMPQQVSFICHCFFHALERSGPNRSLLAAGCKDGTNDNRAAGGNFQAAQWVDAIIRNRTAGDYHKIDYKQYDRYFKSTRKYFPRRPKRGFVEDSKGQVSNFSHSMSLIH